MGRNSIGNRIFRARAEILYCVQVAAPLVSYEGDDGVRATHLGERSELFVIILASEAQRVGRGAFLKNFVFLFHKFILPSNTILPKSSRNLYLIINIKKSRRNNFNCIGNSDRPSSARRRILMHLVQVLDKKKTAECGLLLAKMRGSKLVKNDRKLEQNPSAKLGNDQMRDPCERNLKFENFHHPCFGGDSWCFLAKKRKFAIKKIIRCGTLERKNET